MSDDLEGDLRRFLLTDDVAAWLFGGQGDDNDRMRAISAEALASLLVEFLSERGAS